MPSPQQNWARLKADYGCPLRRGAWYRVVSVSPLEAVVDVEQRAVLLPREYLEIVPTRPTRWTVVREVERSPRMPSEMRSGTPCVRVVASACRWPASPAT